LAFEELLTNKECKTVKTSVMKHNQCKYRGRTSKHIRLSQY